MDQTRKMNWTSQVSIIENSFIDYSKDINSKVAQVIQRMPAPAADGTNGGAIIREKNEILRRQTGAQERALQASIKDKSEELNETTKVAEVKKRVSITNANVKFSSLNEEINELSEQVHKVTDWEIEEDLEIGRGMRKIKSWKENLEKIVKINRSLKEIVINNDIGEDDISLLAADALVNNISDEVYIAARAIEEEDDKRALFTLDTAKPDPIILPIFEGRDDEDYSVFKEKMEKAFIQNRTCKADQLAKLKECLKGNVPDSITKTIEEAWADLAKAFGDPQRVLKARFDSLFKLGNMPSISGKGGFKRQVEWLLQAESLVRGIVELGRSGDMDMNRAAFGPMSVNAILRLFPPYQM